jgi:hypothetical protein
MPIALSAMTPTPARVHQNARALCGHHPCWARPEYRGGIWRRDHYRLCSYCGCIHPGDLIGLLLAGGSWLESARKAGKFFLMTPNPIAGELCRMGSISGPVFDRKSWPRSLRDRLKAPAARRLDFQPSLGERLAGHFERPALELAPPMIRQPFYLEHTNKPQWAEIEAAANEGEKHGR